MIKSEKNKSRFKIIGSLLILIFISCLIGYYLYYYFSNLQKEVLVTDFFGRTTVTQTEENNNKITTNTSSVQNNYIGILEISKIKFKKGFYNIDDKKNNVNKNIQVIENSDMPDVENGMMVIAGHSGNGITAYFKNLHQLNLKDIISIYYKNIKYDYEIYNIYEVEKDGTISVDRNNNFSTLVLTTCKKNNSSKQLVITAKLIEKNSY